MEKHKSKIKDVLKKVSSCNLKGLRATPTETPNPYSILSPKKSVPTSPLRSSHKTNLYTHKPTQPAKKYVLNKTTYGSPLEKS